jgi:hypothetical protein
MKDDFKMIMRMQLKVRKLNTKTSFDPKIKSIDDFEHVAISNSQTQFVYYSQTSSTNTTSVISMLISTEMYPQTVSPHLKTSTPPIRTSTKIAHSQKTPTSTTDTLKIEISESPY